MLADMLERSQLLKTSLHLVSWFVYFNINVTRSHDYIAEIIHTKLFMEMQQIHILILTIFAKY